MSTALSDEDVALILESLRYTKRRFRTYDGYPSEQYRRERIEDVERVERRVRRSDTQSSGG